ncbi:MAG TPA: hypothetical protein VFQ60_00200 [Patescibacteria group bacterium]|nr:hypothetical protein [Patescibacteria group bacterium]
MSEVMGFPRLDKESFLGKSKIEKGLRNFYLYRAAPSRKLIHLQPAALNERRWTTDRLLNRAIFFTTQKNMAMEYAREDKKCLLMKIRGINFLEDLRQCPEEIMVILLSHKDLAFYQRLLSFKSIHDQEVDNFFRAKTMSVRRVSLRALRRAAEIMVILPEENNTVPLEKEHIVIRGIRDTGMRQMTWNAGRFHSKQEQIQKLLAGQYHRDKKAAKDLERTIKEIEDELKERRANLYESYAGDRKKFLEEKARIEFLEKELEQNSLTRSKVQEERSDAAYLFKGKARKVPGRSRVRRHAIQESEESE